MTTAEVFATERHFEYTGLSPERVHALEPTIPIGWRHARRHHQHAYLLSATGTPDSFVVTTRALNGDTYTIKHLAGGSTEHDATVCGKKRSW